MKAIGNSILFSLFCTAFLLFSAGIMDSMNAPKPVSAKAESKAPEILNTPVFASVPTNTAMPTMTASPTRTPLPTSTTAPTIAPSPTRDVAYIEKMNRVDLEYRQGLADINAQWWATFWDNVWNGVKALAVTIMILGFTALCIYAYMRKPKPTATMAPQTTTQATQAQNTWSTWDFPSEWLDMIDWSTGKMPAETPGVYALFGGQGMYRDFLREMAQVGWASKRGQSGWFVTKAFAQEARREIIPQPPTE